LAMATSFIGSSLVRHHPGREEKLTPASRATPNSLSLNNVYVNVNQIKLGEERG